MGKVATISANTLFHFTDDISNLLGILKNNFYPRYSLEDYSAFYTKSMRERLSYYNIAIPMICFCDIPLSSIRNHINIYGKYAVGLTKEWGENNNISPVMYALENSVSAKMIRRTFSRSEKCIHLSNQHFDKLLSKNPNYKLDSKDRLIDRFSLELARIDNRLLEIMAFTKKYKGTFSRNGKKLRNVCFYDEREWRYSPDDKLLFDNQIPSHITKEQYLDVNLRQSANDKLERPDYMLKFTPADIRYIIVSSNDEILPMVDRVYEIKGDKYSHNDLKLLATRIISMEQILEDF